MSVEAVILLLICFGIGAYVVYRQQQKAQQLKHKLTLQKLKEETDKVRAAAGKSDKEFLEAYANFRTNLKEMGITPPPVLDLIISDARGNKPGAGGDDEDKASS